HLVDLFGIAYVELNGQRVDPDLAQSVAALLEMICVSAGDRDARAERAQALRDSQTDAGAASGDHGDLILQQVGFEHDARLSVLRLRHVARAIAPRVGRDRGARRRVRRVADPGRQATTTTAAGAAALTGVDRGRRLGQRRHRRTGYYRCRYSAVAR